MITVLPLNLMRSLIKLMAIWDQGHCAVNSSMSLSSGRVQGALAWADAMQEEMYCWMMVSMLGHQYLAFSRWWHCVPEWPMDRFVYTLVLSLPLTVWGTKVRTVGNAEGT